ncbi:MAG TPA: hypothetical protein VJI74_02040 [Candidatus Paceibacterota bacterium]
MPRRGMLLCSPHDRAAIVLDKKAAHTLLRAAPQGFSKVQARFVVQNSFLQKNY